VDENASGVTALPMGRRSTSDNVPAIVRNQPQSVTRFTPTESEESRGVAFDPQSQHINVEISHSLSLINSSVTVLHSQMRKIQRQEESSDGAYDPQVTVTASMTGKAMADLIKAKVSLMKLGREVYKEDLPPRRKRATRRNR
jgi:hypothetical protein